MWCQGSGWAVTGGWIPFFLLFVVLTLIIINLVYLRSNSRGKSEPSQESALDIIKKRYARGDITKGQYETLKKDLE